MDTVFTSARNAGSAVAAAVWLGSLVWVVADGRARLEQPRLVRASAALAGLLPLAGLVAWLALRPAETARERCERRLRRRGLELEIDGGDHCLLCRTELRPDFLRCPTCGLELRRPCSGCDRPIELAWRRCPYCAAPSEARAALRPTAR